jgi:hypothetical protein
MRKLNLFLALLTVGTALALPARAHACPSCAEAPAASGTADFEDPSNNQAAYNNSIYIMVGVPYFSFGLITFMVYRGMKKNEAFRQNHDSFPSQHVT